MKVRDVMTPKLVMLDHLASVEEAAGAMRDNDIGDVVVKKDGEMWGIVTDRDIAVRAVAMGLDPKMTAIESIATPEVMTVTPDQPAADAISLMQKAAIRRVPVVEDGEVKGILSLGDVEMTFNPESTLGTISAAAPNL